jgi:hypothetical protein
MIRSSLQATENKWLIESARRSERQKRGPQNEGKSEYVIENKPRKNVHFLACVDVYENKYTYSFPQNM